MNRGRFAGVAEAWQFERVVLAAWFSAAGLVGGQPAKVESGPIPGWVKPLQWERPALLGDTHPYSERYLLYDWQENPAQSESYRHVAQWILSETGVQQNGNISINFDPSYQQLFLHQVLIHRADAKTDALDLGKLKIIQPEPGLGFHVYTGMHTAVLFLEDLRVGDVLELAYTIRGRNPVMAGHYWARFFVQSAVPIERQLYRIVWPAGPALFWRAHGTDLQPALVKNSDLIEYTWQIPASAALEFEDGLPSDFEPLPYIELSDYEDWADVVEWGVRLYAVNREPLLPAMRELAREWSAAEPDPAERAARALRFVQDQIRYLGIEFGPNSHQPSAPSETFQRRFGDCKDKAALLCALLGGMGIEAHPAFVDSALRGGVTRCLPSPFAFNHAIVRIDLPNKQIWVDPTRQYQRGSLLDNHLPPYQRALVVRPGEAGLAQVPADATRVAVQRVEAEFVVDQYEGPARLSIISQFSGPAAENIRAQLAGKDRTALMNDYVNYYARFYPGITNPAPLRVEDTEQGVRVWESYSVHGLWQPEKEGGRLVAEFFPENLYGILPDPSKRLRRMPLSIPYPLRHEHEVVVHLPTPWDLPVEERRVDDDAFEFRYNRTSSGKTVRFFYKCETKRDKVAPEDVPVYLEKRKETQDLLGDTLYYDERKAAGGLGDLNWLMLGIALGYGGLVFGGGLWLSLSPRFRTHGPPPLPMHPELQGLGGWLILVGIGTCLTPIVLIVQLAQLAPTYFSASVWQEMAMPQGSNYHPLYGPLLLIELIGNLTLLGLSVLKLVFYFAKRRLFPALFIIHAVFAVGFLGLDMILGAQIPSVAQQTDPSEARTLVRAVTSAAIWCPYMLMSRRVKQTFIR